MRTHAEERHGALGGAGVDVVNTNGLERGHASGGTRCFTSVSGKMYTSAATAKRLV